MPVIAVAAAAASIGYAAATGWAVLATITAVGATVGAVGSVTKNKTLMLIGAGIGIVGAVGTLAFGADALGTMGELFGSTATNSASGAASAAGAAGAASDVAARVAGAEAGYLPGAIASEALPAAAGAADLYPSFINGTSTAATAAPAAAAAAAPAASGTSAISLGAEGAAAAAGKSAYDAGQLSQIVHGLDAGNATSLSSGGILGWAKDNQFLAYSVLQSGGSFISGLTDPLNPAQVAALEAQAKANNAVAAVTQRQADNLASGIPTVTGRPAPVGGIINNSPSRPLITGNTNMPGAAVTGAVA